MSSVRSMTISPNIPRRYYYREKKVLSATISLPHRHNAGSQSTALQEALLCTCTTFNHSRNVGKYHKLVASWFIACISLHKSPRDSFRIEQTKNTGMPLGQTQERNLSLLDTDNARKPPGLEDNSVSITSLIDYSIRDGSLGETCYPRGRI